MPERADALERVRLGDAGILLISPEQLRSRSLRRAVDQREIGGWVLDEAHCLSRWGHDFRPDYRYVGRFIREKAGAGPVPPVLCLTATAKPDVTEDIAGHFRDKLGIELKVFDGGADRPNLTFEVIPTSGEKKFSDIHQVLTSYLPPDAPGGAIVYCATRRQSEEVAEFLQVKEVASGVLPRGPAARNQEGGAAALHRRRSARHRGDQCLRHGDRQAGRAAGHSRRYSRVAGELSSRRPAAPGVTAHRRVACCCTRRKTWNVSSGCRRARGLPGKRSTPSSGRCETWTARSDWAARWWPPLARFWARTRKRRSSGTLPPTTPGCVPPLPGWRSRSC